MSRPAPQDGMSPASVTVGILGGMGPLATAAFYRKIIERTPARCDQDHLHVVVWADPSVPDRSTALTVGGADPTPWLIHGAQQLEAMGAQVIATPCNAAHAFLPKVRASVRAHVIDMIAATVAELRRAHPAVRTVGVLASEGTVRARLYHQPLERAGLRALVPDATSQRSEVTAVIRAVKAGDTGPGCRALIGRAAQALRARGAEALVAGCTEFPLVLDSGNAGIPVIDPTVVLARTVIDSARQLARGRLANDSSAGRPPDGVTSPASTPSNADTRNPSYRRLGREDRLRPRRARSGAHV
jgi:aspartate racemase